MFLFISVHVYVGFLYFLTCCFSSVQKRKIQLKFLLLQEFSSFKFILKYETNTYLTGVVAPEPPLDEHGCVLLWMGDVDSPLLQPGFACETNQESTTCLVAFLNKREMLTLSKQKRKL